MSEPLRQWPPLPRPLVWLVAALLLVSTGLAGSTTCDGRICLVDAQVSSRGSAASGADVLASQQLGAPVQPSDESAPAGRRAAIYMTAVGADGEVYSHHYGPLGLPRSARYGMLALFVLGMGFLYLLLISSPPSEPELSRPTPADPSRGKSAPSTSHPLKDPVPAVDECRPEETSSPAGKTATWAALVHACGGDPVRAGTVIAGEVAADPSLSPDSPEVLTRAISRVRN